MCLNFVGLYDGGWANFLACVLRLWKHSRKSDVIQASIQIKQETEIIWVGNCSKPIHFDSAVLRRCSHSILSFLIKHTDEYTDECFYAECLLVEDSFALFMRAQNEGKEKNNIN